MNDVAEGGIRVTIEAGAQYQPSDRVRTAVAELLAALHETEEPEVAGHGLSMGRPMLDWLSIGQPTRLEVALGRDGSVAMLNNKNPELTGYENM